MKNINHSWKGKVQIDGTDYLWEQFPTSNPHQIKVNIMAPITFTFEYEPQKTSIGNAITKVLQVKNKS